VELSEDLERIAAAAEELAGPEEALAGVIPTEPESGQRVYLCAFCSPPSKARGAHGKPGEGQARTWVALDDEAGPVGDRSLVRSAVAIAALCELAEESAGGGKLDELRAELVSVRLTESPEGVEDAEAAALDLERAIVPPPRLATPAYLDAVGAAARRLEQALGDAPGSPFVEAMKQGAAVLEELEREVLGGYKGRLS
jgi:hypothetical protein